MAEWCRHIIRTPWVGGRCGHLERIRFAKLRNNSHACVNKEKEVLKEAFTASSLSKILMPLLPATYGYLAAVQIFLSRFFYLSYGLDGQVILMTDNPNI